MIAAMLGFRGAARIVAPLSSIALLPGDRAALGQGGCGGQDRGTVSRLCQAFVCTSFLGRQSQEGTRLPQLTCSFRTNFCETEICRERRT